MSSGTSRLAFDYGENVLKVAKNSSGMLNNYYEASQAKLCPSLFPQIVHVHEAKKDRYDFIVAEKVIPLDNRMLKEKAGLTWEELFSLLIWICMKDIHDMEVRKIWHQNYNTYLRCTIKHVKELFDKFMHSNNAVHDFIDNVIKYCGNFEKQQYPDVISDFKIQNLGWSAKNNSIVVLDNGSNVHTNSVWNRCYVNKNNSKRERLLQMISDGKITSDILLKHRNSK